jgi:hypothetical protein
MTSQVDILEVMAGEMSRGLRSDFKLPFGFRRVDRRKLHLLKTFTRAARWNPLRIAKGLKNGNGRFSPVVIAAIRADAAADVPKTVIASKYGVSYGYVGQLVKGERRACL